MLLTLYCIVKTKKVGMKIRKKISWKWEERGVRGLGCLHHLLFFFISPPNISPKVVSCFIAVPFWYHALQERVHMGSHRVVREIRGNSWYCFGEFWKTKWFKFQIHFLNHWQTKKPETMNKILSKRLKIPQVACFIIWLNAKKLTILDWRNN